MMNNPASFYRAVWRWHFYAGLFCIPFVILLAISGSLYLFKPQIEAWIDSPYNHLPAARPRASADEQVAIALKAFPGGRLKSYILPQHPGDAVKLVVRPAWGEPRLVYVDPYARSVLQSVPVESTLMETVKRIHGELLMGEGGSRIVELAACWAIVMIATGLYLWWPRQAAGFAGILFPRLRAGQRVLWRDLHAVTGIWISAFALVLLLTGLPWTGVWGEAFKQLRHITHTDGLRQDWSLGAKPGADEMGGDGDGHMAGMRHHAPMTMEPVHGPAAAAVPLQDIVGRAAALRLAAPVYIDPPKQGAYKVRGMAQNRPLRAVATFDAATGAQTNFEGFDKKHPIDRAVGYGIALHEGQLFGWLNQALGVLTAAGLVLLSVSAAMMWWRRRPEGRLGALPAAPEFRLSRGLAALIVGLGVFLPLLGASLAAVALLEFLVLSRVPPVARFLGLRA